MQAAVKCYTGDECPNGYLPFQRSCYKVTNTELSRADAASACEDSGGHLADITSLDEQEFIVSILTASGGGDAWFGMLKDLDAEGEYKWSDGSPLIHDETWQDIYTYYDAIPDVICMRLREGSEYGWRDDRCSEKYKFVCELEDFSSPVTLISSDSPNKATSEITEKPINSTSAGEGGNGEQLQSDNTVVIAGSIIGVLLFLILALVITLFLYKRSRKEVINTPEPQVQSYNTNPTFEPDSTIENGNDAQPPYNANEYVYVAGAQPDNEYNYVAEAQPDNEYNYVDANYLRSTGNPVSDGNNDDNTYSYAETPVGVGLRPSAPEEQPMEEGWMENKIYSTSDDVGDPNAQEEGWADNTIYGD
ncbi:uncharacterized protein [Amphiura filiformis]|uniref:uncharacterized protein n=1 Tax=Amphiura filiformis TaxID=82378 RepID=UPI003B2224FA